MKKYADYIYEELNSQEFINSYNTISNELKTFWVNLEQEIKKLTPNKEPVSSTETSTTVKPEQKLSQPDKMYYYEYKTNAGDTEKVEIVEPSTETKDTASVRNINKPGDQGVHIAKWINLKKTNEKVPNIEQNKTI